MTTLNATYNAGRRQGEREANGAPMVATPYKQGSLSQLKKYKAHVAGWHAGRYSVPQRLSEPK